MGIFNINSGFVKFVDRAMDVIQLNFLWLLCCLPVVTIGASTCAAYYVSLKMVDDEEGYVGKMFFKAFKDNFKQGTLMWLITAVCIYLGWLIWQVVIKADDVNFLVIVGAIIYTALAVLINLYPYPMIARYENSLKNIIKNSVGMSLLFFWKTVFVTILLALEVFLIFWNKWTLLVGVFIGPECLIYTISGVSKKIFLQMDRYAEDAAKEAEAKKQLHEETVAANAQSEEETEE